MSKVFHWSKVLECLPEAKSYTTTKDDGEEEIWSELSHTGFILRLNKAVVSGELNAFNQQGHLSKPLRELDEHTYLSPLRVNAWFDNQKLDYEWEITQVVPKTATLKELEKSGRLKEDAIKTVKDVIRNRTYGGLFTVQFVAKSLTKLQHYGDFESSSIGHYLRKNWWKNMKA